VFILEISGLILFDSHKSEDERGLFRKVYAETDPNIKFDMREIFYSVSKPGVFRGMHLQTASSKSGRVITLIEGEIIDVFIDLRDSSQTFLNVKEIPWTSDDKLGAIFIPPGVAHGFFAVKRSTLIYSSDNNHVQSLDSGVSIDSLEVSFKSKIETISKRDQSLPSLDQWTKNSVE
jgi:dTDP-4-dehydrorhamnose 3,5-epimerase